jgi:hypothetical protein
MADEATQYDAEQAAKFSGVTDGEYVEGVAKWCQTEAHASFMLKVQRLKVAKRLEALNEAQALLALQMQALNAVKVKIVEQGWSE